MRDNPSLRFFMLSATNIIFNNITINTTDSDIVNVSSISNIISFNVNSNNDITPTTEGCLHVMLRMLPVDGLES